MKATPLTLAIRTGLFLTASISPLCIAEGESGDDTVEYEKIIVTGQKISRTLQETPASIAVFSADKIAQQNTGLISDLLCETANVHTTSGGGFNIRGIDGFNVSGAGSSSLASVYVDGAALPERLVRYSFSTWDASQVEILRGLQSTLQDRNSLAGAIVMTTQAPSHQWSTKYRMQIGENGEKQAAIAFGGSLIADQLAFRFSGEQEDFDGFNYNITRNDHADFKESDLYRLKFLLTPDAIPDFSAQLSYTHASNSEGATGINVPDSGDIFNQRFITNNEKQTQEFKVDIANLLLKYVLNSYWDLTAISTYSSAHPSWTDCDNDNGPQDGGTRFFSEKSKTFSQELLLTVII